MVLLTDHLASTPFSPSSLEENFPLLGEHLRLEETPLKESSHLTSLDFLSPSPFLTPSCSSSFSFCECKCIAGFHSGQELEGNTWPSLTPSYTSEGTEAQSRKTICSHSTAGQGRTSVPTIPQEVFLQQLPLMCLLVHVSQEMLLAFRRHVQCEPLQRLYFKDW